MRAQDILDTTHQLEERGMTRPQAETIAQIVAVAVEPLATREELAAAVEPLATRKDMEAMEKRLDRKIDTVHDQLRKEIQDSSAILVEKVNSRIESTKVWLLGGLLVIALSIVVASLQFAAGSAGDRGVETGQSIRQRLDLTPGPIPEKTELSSTSLLFGEWS